MGQAESNGTPGLFINQNEEKTMSKELYAILTRQEYVRSPYESCDLGEGMTLIKESMWGWWKPRYLLDHRAGEAFELLDCDQFFVHFSQEDVDWSTLKGLSDEAMERARTGNAAFPTCIGRFMGGRAKVSWQISPDGRYYMDDDGFGMTDDEEITLYGEIDRTGRIVKPFSMGL